jgi:hypothetical protein
MIILSASFCGDVGTVINIDSLLITIFGVIISALVVFWNKSKLFLKGIRSIFSLKNTEDKSSEISNAFTGFSLVSFGVCFLSTIQGIYSGFLIDTNLESYKILIYASFTMLYCIDIIVLINIPIIYRFKD